jgi:hypothetical protein
VICKLSRRARIFDMAKALRRLPLRHGSVQRERPQDESGTLVESMKPPPQLEDRGKPPMEMTYDAML